LEGPKFAQDRAEVIARARAAGVACILAIGNGTGPDNLDCAIALARQWPSIFATIGIHPHEASIASQEILTRLSQLSSSPEIIAWGEIGLDYFYDHSPRQVQQEAFVRQMELAAQARLPIIIHCRPSENSDNAWQDTLRLLRHHWAALGLGGILHCFTGDWEHAEAALEMGFMISFSGNVTFPKAEAIRVVASKVPLNRMLIETDSPYLAPVPFRGKRNEPAFVVRTAEKIAEIRGIPLEEVAEATTENFYRFFHISEKMENSGAQQSGVPR
jgi:TatD DNase family protein